MKTTKSLPARPYFRFEDSKRQEREKNIDHSSNRKWASKQTMIIRQRLQRAGQRCLPLRRHLARAFRNWWLEILAGLLLIFAFSGLVAVLIVSIGTSVLSARPDNARFACLHCHPDKWKPEVERLDQGSDHRPRPRVSSHRTGREIR